MILQKRYMANLQQSLLSEKDLVLPFPLIVVKILALYLPFLDKLEALDLSDWPMDEQLLKVLPRFSNTA